ncbi:hypothetical protein TSAR_009320 [Trichomalopsis sarcophagae]|uniref:Uncharacterized protein n=1 Tax=Trichomalopsis sarcophagae TaxID=543379 RepID=A0A232EL98_9HYME|nr:hypothetical protein TSAR_009320 [Trichomalopsis sarcophagae]
MSILPTLGTRNLAERCRHDIRVLRPQKPPSSKTGLISINIDGVLIYCLFRCTLYRLWSHSTRILTHYKLKIG